MKTKVKQVDGLDERLQSSATAYTAGGTATAITLTVPGETYRVGLKLTFIASATDAASAKTINMNGLGAKSFYKPGGTSAPSITSGKAYTVWYGGTSFFLQASAEGNAVVANVLAGKTFSNDSDTGITGTMPDRAGDNVSTSSSVSGTTLKLRPPEGYYDGVDDMVTITDADFIASKILKDTNLFGINGTLEKLNMVEGSVTSTTFGGGGRCDVTVGFPVKMFIWWYDNPNTTAQNEGGFGFNKDANAAFNAPTYYDATYSRTYETTGFRGYQNTFYVRTEDYAAPSFSGTGFAFFTITSGRAYRYIAIY